MKKIITLLLLTTIGYAQQKKQPSIPKDKLMHFTAGTLISAFSFLPAYALQSKYRTGKKRHNRAVLISAGVATAFGLAKELYDSRKGGTGFNNADLVATALGSVTASVTLNLFTGKKRKNKYRY